ncbi:MAG TPA: helix-turn-helix transcriptional regulator [Actinomycetota bacterium]|jgi:MerR family transcriptional regulator, heat shock protein HspR|nr:helix-turn-helix transcriptional regulator [Actinomycetota bacterium]
MDSGPLGSNQAIYVISVAAELAGVHPQTLRVYERKGLLTPARTAGNTRRYSERDIDRLRRIQQLTQEGVNLAGVMQIMELEERLERARLDLEAALDELDRMERRLEELMQARDAMSLVPARDVRRIRRAMRSDAIEKATRRRVFSAPAASSDNDAQQEV